MNKSLLYDVGVASIAVSLWVTPWNFTRAVGYSTSLIFYGRAYVKGQLILRDEETKEEKEAISEEFDVEYHTALMDLQSESLLEVTKIALENTTLEALTPLIQKQNRLRSKLEPLHPELTDEAREQAARQAIDSAFVEDKTEAIASQQITEEDIRKQFPETMDNTSWKAILKALQGGAIKADIITDVLGCSQGNARIGEAYFELLKGKYL